MSIEKTVKCDGGGCFNSFDVSDDDSVDYLRTHISGTFSLITDGIITALSAVNSA
jgi:hypothetical protein